MNRLLLVAALALAPYVTATEYEDCFTDSCVFAQCADEQGRPCTEEEIFGPVEEEDDDRLWEHAPNWRPVSAH